MGSPTDSASSVFPVPTSPGQDHQRRPSAEIAHGGQHRSVLRRAPAFGYGRVEEDVGLGHEVGLDGVYADERGIAFPGVVVRELLGVAEQAVGAYRGRKVFRATRTPPAL